MRKLTQKALTAGAVAATTLALTAMPASAAGGWTASPGGAVTGTNAGAIQAVDLNTGSPLVCTNSTATGTVATSDADGIGIASLSSVNFSTPGNPNNWCDGPTGIVVKVTAMGLPWSFDADPGGYDALTGKTTGKLTGVKVKLESNINCTAEITAADGSGAYISGEHTNPTNPGDPSTLTVSGANNLVVTSVTEATCPDTLINVGDTAALMGTYNLSPGQTISYTP
ncbi:hypothetical protein HUT06_35230 [Actinomadura sp. NAK00032]|uniref:hypothetical protein n=1 Tax=Actinomadura sp. NAK00032 TaxID=2742128 RepID=UPI0015917FF5|nr:hypothetical protein [Actinomadura sp. NAK00032]QKW38626.1 hypothetical protein HUT06_35230 [Actinomadura sp. NAK00032]